MSDRIITDARKAFYNGSVITSATSLPMLCTEGLNNKGVYYINNTTTGAVYYIFKPCGINTAATASWGSGTTTATVVAGAVTASTFNIVGNYMTMEYVNTATGAGSAIIQMSVW